MDVYFVGLEIKEKKYILKAGALFCDVLDFNGKDNYLKWFERSTGILFFSRFHLGLKHLSV